MAEGNGKPQGKWEKAVESVAARSITRFVVPALVGLLVYFASEMRSDLRANIKETGAINGKLNLIEYRLDRLEKKP